MEPRNVTELLMMAGVVLLAVIVGAAIPALLQLRATLKSAQVFLEMTGAHLDRTLAEADRALARVNHLGETLEKGTQSARSVIESGADLRDRIAGIRDWVGAAAAIGGAVVPAILAILRGVPGGPGETKTASTAEGGPDV